MGIAPARRGKIYDNWMDFPKFKSATEARAEYVRIRAAVQALNPEVTNEVFQSRAIQRIAKHWPYADPPYDHDKWLYAARSQQFSCRGCGNTMCGAEAAGVSGASKHKCRGRSGAHGRKA